MKIVLDTNVLVSGIFWGGTPARLLQLWVSDSIQIVATDEIFKEYVDVIERLSSPENIETAKQWKTYLSENIKIIISISKLKICRDPDDDKFINCAISSKSEYIVSGDNDLLDLKLIDGIRIIKTNDILKIIDRLYS